EARKHAAGDRRDRRRRARAQLSPVRSGARPAARERRAALRADDRHAVGIDFRRGEEPQHGPRQRDGGHGRPSRSAARAERAEGSAGAPCEPAVAHVPRHVRPAAVADSTRARHRVRRQARHGRAWHAHQGSTGTPVKTFSIVAVALAVAVLSGRSASLSGERQQPPQVPFRAGIDLVSLNVTVTDGTAQYVTDLSQADFNVFEDGVKQEVTFFNKTNLPIALALLLDTSASMESKLPTAQEAAIGFARKLRPQDLAEV